MKRKTHFDQVPLKPQRVYEEMNKAFGRDTTYVTTIGLSQIAGAQFLHVYKPRNWINCGQAGPLGWTLPAALGVRAADPDRNDRRAVGRLRFPVHDRGTGGRRAAQAALHPCRREQRLSRPDPPGAARLLDGFRGQPRLREHQPRRTMPRPGYGVDHVAVAEAHGLQGDPGAQSPKSSPAPSRRRKRLMKEHQVPVVLEFILERVTNISMGTEIDKITEFEELAESHEDAPTAIVLLD